MPAFGSGGGYDGPLAYRMGKPMCPDVAAAFDRTAAAARSEAGLFLSINSAWLRRRTGEIVAQKPNLICFPLCKPHSAAARAFQGEGASRSGETDVRDSGPSAAGVSRCAPAAGALRYAS